MNSMSFLFIGLMLVPFTIFLIWLMRQDKKKNYLGMAVLLIAILATVIVAIYVDAKYMKLS
ncbi:putative membrane protein YqjE [Pedobacter sp. CG_S7]